MSLLDTASLIVTPNGYKEGKLYSVIPSDGSGDLSVTRATTATRVNSQGLVELVPYNLLTYSNTFSNAAWNKINSSVTSGQSGYDGSTNAWKLQATATNNCEVDQGFSESETKTFSIYAKAGNVNFVAISVFGAGFGWYNLSNGTLGSSGGTFVSRDIESVGNGWYRCSIVTNVAASGVAVYVCNADNSIATSVGSNIFIQNSQLESGSVPTTYQKTETRLNIPRLDYSNGTCPSILVEPQRTNRLFYSEKLLLGYAFAYTSGTFTVTENTTETLDPFGNNNADKFNATTQAYNDSYTSTSGSGNLTLSIFAKKGTNDTIQLYHDNVLSGGAFSATFNLTSGTITASSGTASIQDLGNGWFRCSVSGTDSNSAGNIHGVITYTGTTYLFGIQLEQGNYVTSYIPTTSASVTRNADVISKTGINSTIIPNSNAFTFFFDLELKGNDPTYDKIALFDTTSGNRLFLYANIIGIINWNNTVNLTMNTRNKIAIRKNNATSVSVFVNGSLATTLTPVGGNAWNPNEMYFYGDNGAAIHNASAIWPTALTDAQCQTLTTI